MVGNQTHDALGIGGYNPVARVEQPLGQTINPQPSIGIEHHLDHGGIGKVPRDRRSHRRAQHGHAALSGTRSQSV